MTNSQTDNSKTATPRAENRPAGSGPRSAGGGVKSSLATACPVREIQHHTAPGPKAGKIALSNGVTEVMGLKNGFGKNIVFIRYFGYSITQLPFLAPLFYYPLAENLCF